MPTNVTRLVNSSDVLDDEGNATADRLIAPVKDAMRLMFTQAIAEGVSLHDLQLILSMDLMAEAAYARVRRGTKGIPVKPVVTSACGDWSASNREPIRTILTVRLPDGTEHGVRFYTNPSGVIRYESHPLVDGPHEFCWILRPLTEFYARLMDGEVMTLPHELYWAPNWPEGT